MRYILLIVVSCTYLFANAHIFVYHRFGDDRHPSTNTTIKQLEEQFQYFKKNGYTVVPIEKIIDKVSLKQKIPDNWVALTIDDGYKSFYKNGLPLFKKYNYPFALYIYVKATQKKFGDFMTWEEIKESSKYGTIGLHSYGHKRMTQLSEKEVFQDTKKGYDTFTEKLGFKPKTYVHPYGEYNTTVINELKKFNFDAIFNQNSGSVNQNSDLSDLNRIAFVGEVNVEEKLRYITMDAQWLYPLEFPKDGILKKVKAKVNSSYKTMKLYITGEGWREVSVKDGLIDEKFNLYLKKARTRIILSPNYYTISNNIIIKNLNKTKEK